jgi:hypothetical protein
MESYGSWTNNGSELAREIRSWASDGTGREIRNSYNDKVSFEGRDRFFISDYRGTWLRRRGGELSPGQKDPWGRTPLMYAAARGDSALVSALLNQGAALTNGDMWNRTPLFYAAGADRSIKDNDENTALHLFCRHVRSSAMAHWPFIKTPCANYSFPGT